MSLDELKQKQAKEMGELEKNLDILIKAVENPGNLDRNKLIEAEKAVRRTLVKYAANPKDIVDVGTRYNRFEEVYFAYMELKTGQEGKYGRKFPFSKNGPKVLGTEDYGIKIPALHEKESVPKVTIEEVSGNYGDFIRELK